MCRKQSLQLHMAHKHSFRPVEAEPVQYCTYHWGPLNPLICCQTGRPGRKPWRGSCVNRIQGKREKQKQDSWKTIRTYEISNGVSTNAVWVLKGKERARERRRERERCRKRRKGGRQEWRLLHRERTPPSGEFRNNLSITHNWFSEQACPPSLNRL